MKKSEKEEILASFPPESELKRIRKMTSDLRRRWNVALPEHPTLIQKTKYEICQKISKHQRENE